MILNTKRGSVFLFATVIIETVVAYGRRGAHLVFEVLHGAYDTQMEKAQMRLAPVKPRLWREIPRAEGHDDYSCCWCPRSTPQLAPGQTRRSSARFCDALENVTSKRDTA